MDWSKRTSKMYFFPIFSYRIRFREIGVQFWITLYSNYKNNLIPLFFYCFLESNRVYWVIKPNTAVVKIINAMYFAFHYEQIIVIVVLSLLRCVTLKLDSAASGSSPSDGYIILEDDTPKRLFAIRRRISSFDYFCGTVSGLSLIHI